MKSKLLIELQSAADELRALGLASRSLSLAGENPDTAPDAAIGFGDLLWARLPVLAASVEEAIAQLEKIEAREAKP